MGRRQPTRPLRHRQAPAHGSGKRRPLQGLLLVALGVTTLVAVLASLASASAPSRSGSAARSGHQKSYVDPVSGHQPLPPGTQMLYVGRPAPVHPIRPGFLGLSFEFPAIERYAGTDPSALDPVFIQLIRNLAPFQQPVIRIGGDSTDRTWWPVRGMSQPAGVGYSLGSRWLQVTSALTQTLRAHLIVGLNLESGENRITTTEAHVLAAYLPHDSILAFEPGNAPATAPGPTT